MCYFKKNADHLLTACDPPVIQKTFLQEVHMVTTETTLNGILSAWGMDSEPDPPIPPQAAETLAHAEPIPSDHPMPGMSRLGRGLPNPRAALEPKADGFGASIGRRLLGNVCDKSEVASGANRIVELCRKYPVRPYLVDGGGRGFKIPNGWGANETNWAVVKEFERLWWSEAGDSIVERYADRLPMVGRDLWEKNEPDGVGLPRSRTGRRP